MTTTQQRLDALAALAAEARQHAAHPQYVHGDVASSMLAYCAAAIPEDVWRAAVEYARGVYVDRTLTCR